MAKTRKRATQSDNFAKEDVLIPLPGESLRAAADRLGLSTKEIWKAKQAQDREQRAIRNAKKKEQVLLKIPKKTASPKKATVKRERSSQIFPFQNLPGEVREQILKYALIKRKNKKSALLTALRILPSLYREALDIYYQVNCFPLGLIEDSPLPSDVEDNSAIQLMRHIKLHVPYVTSFPILANSFN